MVTKCDNFLILDDFNIHLCCPSNPVARNFLHLIDSLNLTPSVIGPTQVHGHILDLILTFGILVSSVQIHDVSLSDLWPTIFSTPPSSLTPEPSLLGNYASSIIPFTARQKQPNIFQISFQTCP